MVIIITNILNIILTMGRGKKPLLKVGDPVGGFLYVGEYPSVPTSRRVMLKCNCGSVKPYFLNSVVGKNIKHCFSCGVKSRTPKHGLSKHPLKSRWSNIKQRCYNTTNKSYPSYGMRGIKMSADWVNNFKSFYDWCIENGWDKNLQIDRIDVNGDYSPSNCRFVEQKEQFYNKQNTIYVDVNGEKVCLKKALQDVGRPDIYDHIRHGMNRGKTFTFFAERFELFKDLIAEEEKKHIPKYLL